MIERYTRPEMAKIWSDEHRLRLMVKVEAEHLQVLGAEKGIGAADLKSMKGHIDRSFLEKARAREATAGHEVVGLVGAIADAADTAAPSLSRYLHYGLTSSDVLDTALALQLREAADLLIEDWRAAADRIKALARKHERTWMAGRTHGIHGEPITFGAKLAGWHAEALRNIDRLARARKLISFGKLSGAIGTFAHLPPSLEEEVCRRLGLAAEPVSTQVIPRDRHAEFFGALVLSASAVERFALEIRHLQRTEVGEAEEPFEEGQKGSSAMPHKRNPVLCENLCGLARLIRTYQPAISENAALWHERDISHSSVERVAITDACVLLDFMLARLRKVLEGLVVYPERMRKNMDLSRGMVFSQKVLLRLIDAGMPRLAAYDAVQAAAMKSFHSQKPFLETLSVEAGVVKRLSKKELAACFDLESYGGAVREMLKRGGVY